MWLVNNMQGTVRPTFIVSKPSLLRNGYRFADVVLTYTL